MYQIDRVYQNHPEKRRTIRRVSKLTKAQAHCQDPEASSRTCTSTKGKRRTKRFGPWFECFTEV